ncbi:MAG: hypothetical protein ACKOQ3_04520, partial [Novosphingobium sp.]
KNALGSDGNGDGGASEAPVQPAAAAPTPADTGHSGGNHAAFALRARLIALRSTLANALHEA